MMSSRLNFAASLKQGIRGCVTISSLAPMRKRSPMLISLSIKPSVVKFSRTFPRQFNSGQIAAPEIVMLRRVSVDGLVRPAVNFQIGLTVAVEIEFAHGDAARDRLFEDSRSNRAVLPEDFARQSDVD